MRTKKPLISAVINTRNEAKSLSKCLKSLKGFVDEIIVVDMRSSDKCAQIAQSYGAKVFSFRPMKVVEHARNYALSKATGRWILLLDPDEYIHKDLKKELIKITQRSDVDYVKIPRKNIIFGKWLKHTNMWPDYLIRFFKNGAVTWKREIHSQPKTVGNGINLVDSEKFAIRHNNYNSIIDYLNRAIRYSGVQADELKANDYKIKISDFILKPTQEFNSRFFVAQGFKDGLHGLIFSILQSFSIFLIYVRLWEKQGSSDKPLAKDSFVSASLETNFEYSYWFSKYFTSEHNPNLFQKMFIHLSLWLNRITKNF